MPELAIIAALPREVSDFVKGWKRAEREHDGRQFTFFERDEIVLVCGGIGVQAARRAAETAFALYGVKGLWSVGFAGALKEDLRVGDVIAPSTVIDSRDGSRSVIGGGKGVLLTHIAVAGREQKKKLSETYGAEAVDMEAAGVAAAANAHNLKFRAIKVISDDLNFEMPAESAFDRFIDGQGRFREGKFATFVAIRPWLWGGTMQLARNSRRASHSLAEDLRGRIRQVHSGEPLTANAIAGNMNRI